MIRIIFSAIAVTILSSCALNQTRPDNPPKSDSVIGFVYLGEEYAKHIHIAQTIFHKGFEHNPGSNTNYKELMMSAVEGMLTKNEYKIVHVDASHISEKTQIQPVVPLTGSMRTEFKVFLENERNKNNLDYIFVFGPTWGPDFPNSQIYIHGFGIYSSCYGKNCTSKVLNYYSMDIYDASTLKRIDLWNWWGYHNMDPFDEIDFSKDYTSLNSNLVDKAAMIFINKFVPYVNEKLIWGRFIEDENIDQDGM